MKNIRFLLAFSCLLTLNSIASAQTLSDCEKLLKRDIAVDGPEQVLKNFTTTKCFGLDSVDLKVFGSGPVLGSLLVKVIQTKGHQKTTYGDLLMEINKSKADKGYPKIRAEIIAMNTLESMKATPKTWEKGKALLIAINTPADEINELYAFMIKSPNKRWNYRQLMMTYEQTQKASTKP